MRSSRARGVVLFGMAWLVANLAAAKRDKPSAASAPASATTAVAPAPASAPEASAPAPGVAVAPAPLPPPPADLAVPPPQAKRLESGLVSLVLAPGSGTERARPQDMVMYYHVGWTADGKVFDSALVRGRPASTRVRKAIAGLGEALKDMAIGEKRRLWIPEKLGYAGRPGKPAGALVIEVELVSIHREADPLPAPPDVAAVPKDAEKTASGLAWRRLKRGTGTRHPLPPETVEVVFTGWTPDGAMFVTSTTRPRPDALRVDQCIAGWKEALQLMVEGDVARFWIPGALAYEHQPEGGPAGMVVFDLELVKIR